MVWHESMIHILRGAMKPQISSLCNSRTGVCLRPCTDWRSMVVVPEEEASVPGPSPILDRYERPESHSLRTKHKYSWHRNVFMN
jgi:hypothetical protein